MTLNIIHKLVSYTTMCNNLHRLLLAFHVFYLFPVVFFDDFARYDHLTSMNPVNGSRKSAGIVFFFWVSFLVFTSFFLSNYRKSIGEKRPNCVLHGPNYQMMGSYQPFRPPIREVSVKCECGFHVKQEIIKIRRLILLLLIMEAWNFTVMLTPVWAVYYYIEIDKPTTALNYILESIFKKEALAKIGPLVMTVLNLVHDIDRTIISNNRSARSVSEIMSQNRENCDSGSEIDISVDDELNALFRAKNVGPLLAILQVCFLIIVYYVVFVHVTYVKCIHYGFKYKKVLENEHLMFSRYQGNEDDVFYDSGFRV